MLNPLFFDRDLSWLSFNERILQLAAQDDIPVMERVNFLAIFSSNLDEFYRVRMPVLFGLDKLGKLKGTDKDDPLQVAQQMIKRQQQQFGQVLSAIIPLLQANNIQLVFREQWPAILNSQVTDYFFSQVMAFVQPIELSVDKNFFPQNNLLYFLVNLEHNDGLNERQYSMFHPRSCPGF